MESDSLVDRTVPAVDFVPASIVSSNGFTPIRRRAKRKPARIFESSDIGNVDNCLVNDNNGDTASNENGQAVDIIIDDVNSDSQASNSSVANHSTASMNDNSTNNNISCDISHTGNVNSSKDDNSVSSNSNSTDAINNCSDNSSNDTSCAASCSGVNNDISSGDIISNCVVSDNTTDITDNGNDIGNSNSSNVNNCKNDKNIVVNNASSSHGNNSNNSNVISNIDCSTILVDNVPSNANDKIDKVNDNDNNGSITWYDIMAMEEAARELVGVPVPASPPVIDPNMARTARRSDRLQQSYIPRRLTRASAKSKT